MAKNNMFSGSKGGKIVVVIDGKEDLAKALKLVEKSVYFGAIDGARELSTKTVSEYRRRIDEGMKEYGQSGHTKSRESVSEGAISITAEPNADGAILNVLQSSLAGKMIELEKPTIGALIKRGPNAGKYLIPNTTARGLKWLKEKNINGTNPVMLKNPKVSGKEPFKPMTNTFDKFTLPNAFGIVSNNILDELNKKFPQG